jgi:valyl-tRNA synthetase
MLIASGGTAGYCAISKKAGSRYELEYIQAWLANPYTEKLFSIVGSDFEGGFISRGTAILAALPFVQLDFSDAKQKAIYDRVVEASREVYQINAQLDQHPSKQIETTLQRQKKSLITEIENLISRVYRLEF